jgi:hypothetical protein
MPHYPDEIEYSDKYMDDYYEYRHVLLPKDVYKRIQKGRLLSESVIHALFRNGELWEFNSQEDGFTTSFTGLSLTFFSLEGQREVILNLDFHLQDLSHHLTLFATENLDFIQSAFTYQSFLLPIINSLDITIFPVFA